MSRLSMAATLRAFRRAVRARRRAERQRRIAKWHRLGRAGVSQKAARREANRAQRKRRLELRAAKRREGRARR